MAHPSVQLALYLQSQEGLPPVDGDIKARFPQISADELWYGLLLWRCTKAARESDYDTALRLADDCRAFAQRLN